MQTTIRSVATAAIIGIMLASPARAEDRDSAPLGPQSPYGYYLDLAEALAQVKSALVRTAKAEASLKKTKGEDPDSAVTEVFVAYQLAGREYGSALERITPYRENPSETVSKSAQLLALGISTIASLHDETIAEFKKRLDGDKPMSGAGTEAQHLAELAVRARDAWRAFLTGVVMATHAAVAPKTKGRLLLSRRERADVVQRLKDGKITRTPRSGGSSFDIAAGSFFDFLTDKGWKTTDTK